MRPDELATRARIHLPDDGPYETLAGLVMTRLGRIPQVGDEVSVAQVVLRVEAMEGRRVTRLRIVPIAPPDDAESAPGHADAPGTTGRRGQ